MLELTLTATPPTYETILELDRRVREKVLPPSLNLYRSSSIDEYTTPTAYVRGRMLFTFRTSSTIFTLEVALFHSSRVSAMLYIHRSFFAQAVLDFPSNPLRSPFAPSFLAAYRCASAIIKTTAINFQKYPELFARFWSMWNHLLSAAVSPTICGLAWANAMSPDYCRSHCYKGAVFYHGTCCAARTRSSTEPVQERCDDISSRKMWFGKL